MSRGFWVARFLKRMSVVVIGGACGCLCLCQRITFYLLRLDIQAFLLHQLQQCDEDSLHARIVHTACTYCARCTHALCKLHARNLHTARTHRARCMHALCKLHARTVHTARTHRAHCTHALCRLQARTVHTARMHCANCMDPLWVFRSPLWGRGVGHRG